MIRIWGRRNSVNVQKVLWAADELGLEWEQVDVGGEFGGLDSAEYGVLNPNQRIPTIEDDGMVIWESNVIVRYLAARYGAGSLSPEDPAVRAIADMWMEWVQTTVIADMTVVFWGLIRTPPEERDMGRIENSAKELGRIWSRLDNHLAEQPYIAGDAFTMGDIPAGAMAERYYALDCWRPDLPRLEAWIGRLREREAFQKHCTLPLS